MSEWQNRFAVLYVKVQYKLKAAIISSGVKGLFYTHNSMRNVLYINKTTEYIYW
jgi:hypothetical protein